MVHARWRRILASSSAALLLMVAGSAVTVSNSFARVSDDGAVMAAWTAAAGPSVGQEFSAGVARFFADAAAKDNAHPSYALLAEPASAAALKSDPAVKPVFGTFGGKHSARITITPGTSLYGTGEVAGQLLRNGRSVTTWNTDAYGYGDEAKSLYQSHPWVLAVRPDGTAFGVLADTTYRCTVDTAASDANEIRFIADGPAFPVIVIDKASPQEVLKELANLTGKMAMPPKWAIGYHQCRYSYFPESRVREVAKEFRDRKIPCDIIWFDIDYMEGFRVFTFDRGHFPDPAKLNADLHAQGYKTVYMIDPGLKSRDDRSPNDPPQEVRDKEPQALKDARAKEIANYVAIRDDGKSKNVYVTRADGSVYEGEVWPGWCYFPDYTSPTVRQWWAGLYKDFMAQGIDGVWNDMNEPAVFNVKSKTMPEDNRHAGDPAMVGPNGKPQGEKAAGDHARYHNVYGMQMIKGSLEGIAAINPDKRPFVLSRANYIGGQRYGATWTGDNTANWYHVETSIPMVLNVGLSGQPFIGPDIGGFAGNGDGPMFARWMGFGALFPFARGHTGKENINKEPWAFGPAVEATSRAALEMRYVLLPYYYTLFHEASVNGLPIARPTFFADPRDPALRSEDDSFLLGDALLVQTQVVPDRTRTSVTPKGIWRTFSAPADQDLPRILIKGGSIVPSGPIVQHVDSKPLEELTLTIALDDKGQATGTLYEDAGEGYGYQKGEFALTTYQASVQGDSVVVKVAKREGSMQLPKRTVKVALLVEGPNGSTRTVNSSFVEDASATIKP
jgi:alpha-glucosidase